MPTKQDALESYMEERGYLLNEIYLYSKTEEQRKEYLARLREVDQFIIVLSTSLPTK